MARHLLKAGFPITVFNRDRAKAAPIEGLGARVAGSPKEAVRDASFVVAMVADDTASRAVWLGENGAIHGVAPGAVCIDSSTLSVGWVKELAAALGQRGAAFLDAPVTGSKAQAHSGELNFFVGGDETALEKARPVFAAMAKNVTHVGPTGGGALLKLVNNFVCGTQVVAFAEAIALAERAGLNRERVFDLLTNGAGGSPIVKTIAARVAASDFTPNFFLRLMAKDLGYAQDEAAKVSLELAMAGAALGRFKEAIAKGHGDKDMAAVIEGMRQVGAR